MFRMPIPYIILKYLTRDIVFISKPGYFFNSNFQRLNLYKSTIIINALLLQYYLRETSIIDYLKNSIKI